MKPRDFVGLAGLAAVGYGLFAWSRPLSIIYGGILLVVLALAAERGEARKPKR